MNLSSAGTLLAISVLRKHLNGEGSECPLRVGKRADDSVNLELVLSLSSELGELSRVTLNLAVFHVVTTSLAAQALA